MAITTPKQAFDKIHPPIAVIPDEKIEQVLNEAIRGLKSAAPGTRVHDGIVGPAEQCDVDIGETPMSCPPGGDPNARRAMDMAREAGWEAELDGRSGGLVLVMPSRATPRSVVHPHYFKD